MSVVQAIQKKRNQLRIQVHVQTRASRAEWGKLFNDEWLQLRVTALPVDGAANKACIKFIAAEFKTAKSNVELIKGEKSRYKIFLVNNFNPAALEEFLGCFS